MYVCAQHFCFVLRKNVLQTISRLVHFSWVEWTPGVSFSSLFQVALELGMRHCPWKGEWTLWEARGGDTDSLLCLWQPKSSLWLGFNLLPGDGTHFWDSASSCFSGSALDLLVCLLACSHSPWPTFGSCWKAWAENWGGFGDDDHTQLEGSEPLCSW